MYIMVCQWSISIAYKLHIYIYVCVYVCVRVFSTSLCSPVAHFVNAHDPARLSFIPEIQNIANIIQNLVWMQFLILTEAPGF